MRRALVAAALALAALAPSASAAPPAISVVGNRLVAGHRTVRLLGVDLSGAEYACIEGTGFFDTPTDDRQLALIASWGANAVRVPLNEGCWLGLHAPAAYAGRAYRRAIAALVRRLHRHGLYAILDLHWNAPGDEAATGLRRLADRDHSPAFWSSVARAFRTDRAVLFDLYNEPHDVGWRCWRDGCRLRGPYRDADDVEPRSWTAAGMQTLVDAVRAARAPQPLLLGGLDWANDLRGFLRFRPRDPLRQLVASVHVYDFTECTTPSCWRRTIASVAARVPVVSGEIGEGDCRDAFTERYMRFADAHGISYLAWQWGAFGCRQGPSLLAGYDGTPTAYGFGVRRHLRALARRR